MANRRRVVVLIEATAFVYVLMAAMWAPTATASTPSSEKSGRPYISFAMASSFVFDLEDPDGDAGNNATLYANGEGQDESFNIDLAQLAVYGKRGNAAYALKLDFGDLASFIGDAEDGDVGIQEAYLAYSVGVLNFNAGRFATPIGYEVLEPWGNAFISRSRAWSLYPISHDGVTVGTSLGGVDLMFGVANSVFILDSIANDLNDQKALIGSVGGDIGKVALSLSAIYSKEVRPDQRGSTLALGDVDQIFLNAIASTQLDRMFFAVESNWLQEDPKGSNGGKTADTWNVIGYAGTKFGRFTFDVRADYGQYELIFTLPTETRAFDVWSVTTTVGFEIVKGMELRLEYRRDQTDISNLFADDDQLFGADHAHVLQAQIVLFAEP